MKYTVVFLFPLLIFNCQSSNDKDFKIKISSSDKIISNGDTIKINIESKSGQIIDSVAYYLNEKRGKKLPLFLYLLPKDYIMSNDYEIFKGKSLSSLFQDIYENQNYNRKQLDVLTRNITSMIKDGDTAVQIVPMIKEYLEINVRNDELLVKLAGIVQKIITAESKGESESEFGLSEIEKQEIMNTILEHDTKELEKNADKIRKDIEAKQ